MACPSEIIMPTIKARKQANGSTRYTAVVRIRRGTTVLHQESRTFTHRTAALSWARHREVALEDPAALTRQSARCADARGIDPLVDRDVRDDFALAAEQADPSGISRAPLIRQAQCTHPHGCRPHSARAVASCGRCWAGYGAQRPDLDWRR